MTRLRPWPRHDRGFVLWIFGLTVALSGTVNYIISAPPAYVVQMLVIPFHYLHIPPVAWGTVFVACGLFAMVVAFSHEQDRYGYTTLTTLCAFSALCYFVGVPLGGQVRGLGGAVIYGLFALLLYRLAGYDDTLDADPIVP